MLDLRLDARANHERIVQAATEAFAEKGLGVEMKEIADRAHVAIGTIYRHFPSKEELLAAIVQSLIADAIADADACAALPDPLAALTALVVGNLRRCERFGSLIGAMIGGQLPRHHLAQLKAGAEAHRVKECFGLVIRRCIEEGSLRSDLDPGIAAAMLEGTTMPWVHARIADGRTPDEMAREIMNTFLTGAAPQLQGGGDQGGDRRGLTAAGNQEG